MASFIESVDEMDEEYLESDDIVLIQTVERYPSLYDKGNSGYKDQLRKENAWTAIAEALGKSVVEVQRDWERLRRRYTKTRREIKEPAKSGSAASHTRPWSLYRHMQFLDSYVATRKTTGNLQVKKITSPRAIAVPAQKGCSPWDLLGPGMPLEVLTPHASSSTINSRPSVSTSSLTSSLSSELNIHLNAKAQPSSTPSTPRLHRTTTPYTTSTSLPASRIGSPSLPASQMSSPDPFHLEKKQKVEGFEAFLRSQLSQNNLATKELAKSQERPSETSADENFSKYLCQLFKSIEPLQRRLMCQQQVISVISEFIAGNDE